MNQKWVIAGIAVIIVVIWLLSPIEFTHKGASASPLRSLSETTAGSSLGIGDRSDGYLKSSVNEKSSRYERGLNRYPARDFEVLAEGDVEQHFLKLTQREIDTGTVMDGQGERSSTKVEYQLRILSGGQFEVILEDTAGENLDVTVGNIQYSIKVMLIRPDGELILDSGSEWHQPRSPRQSRSNAARIPLVTDYESEVINGKTVVRFGIEHYLRVLDRTAPISELQALSVRIGVEKIGKIKTFAEIRLGDMPAFIDAIVQSQSSQPASL